MNMLECFDFGSTWVHIVFRYWLVWVQVFLLDVRKFRFWFLVRYLDLVHSWISYYSGFSSKLRSFGFKLPQFSGLKFFLFLGYFWFSSQVDSGIRSTGY